MADADPNVEEDPNEIADANSGDNDEIKVLRRKRRTQKARLTNLLLYIAKVERKEVRLDTDDVNARLKALESIRSEFFKIHEELQDYVEESDEELNDYAIEIEENLITARSKLTKFQRIMSPATGMNFRAQHTHFSHAPIHSQQTSMSEAANDEKESIR